MISPIVLSGGKGSRLWPLSRVNYPKQYLSVLGELSLLQLTVSRLTGLQFDKPTVICNKEQGFLVAAQLKAIGVIPNKILLENSPRNTAPAIAVACLLQQNPEQLLLVLPADHIIKNLNKFNQAINIAQAIAKQGKIVAFGIKPTIADPNYGYIEYSGNKINKFVEKPGIAEATEFVRSGDHLWNSGILLFKARTMLAELAKYQPKLLAMSQKIVAQIRQEAAGWALNFNLIPEQDSISIDYAVMEKTKLAAVVPADLLWSDVGTWDALYRASKQDQDGNVLSGDIITSDVTNCYIKTEDKLVAAIGIKDIIITATKDAVLVSGKNNTAQLNKIVKKLQDNSRKELSNYTIVYRPWGSYHILDEGIGFKVKKLIIKPGEQTSTQFHLHRSEHWVVIKGEATIIKGHRKILLQQNQSIYIAIGEKHQIANLTTEEIHLIEVQSGEYLEEDDIVRVEDLYDRIE